MAKVVLVKGGKTGIDTKALVDGQLLFDVESRVYYLDTVVNSSLTRIRMGEKQPFVGTQAEWDALTPTQKAYYADTTVLITDDYIERSEVMEPPTQSAPGKSGLVPVPQIGDEDKFLKGDGTWATVSTSEASWTYNSSTETVTYTTT